MATIGKGFPSDPRHTDGCATWHHGLVAGIVASYENCVYIEIGVLYALCWLVAAPIAKEAHGVDPDGRCGDLMEGVGKFWHMPSDQFFKEYDGSTPDVIFVDGDHDAKQVLPDVKNALSLLGPYGTLIMHDTQPVIWPTIDDYPERPDQVGPLEGLSGTAWHIRDLIDKDGRYECLTFQRFPGITLVRER